MDQRLTLGNFVSRGRQHEAEQERDLVPAQAAKAPLPGAVARAPRAHERAALQGAAPEVRRPLHAHQEGRRGPGRQGALQGTAGEY